MAYHLKFQVNNIKLHAMKPAKDNTCLDHLSTSIVKCMIACVCPKQKFTAPPSFGLKRGGGDGKFPKASSTFDLQ